MTQAIDLGAARRVLICESGDDVLLPTRATGLDASTLDLVFTVSKSNVTGDGPCGDALGGSVTDVSGEAFTIRIDGQVTSTRSREALWGVLHGTIEGARRTLVELLIQVQ